MSAGYDEYKEEALRLLMNESMLVDAVRKHIGTLRATFCPAVKIQGLNESHYRTWEKFVITIAGSCSVLDDRQVSYGHYQEIERNRRQRRWVVRKLKEYGEVLQSAKTCVTSHTETVYFSYHLIIPMNSHLVDS